MIPAPERDRAREGTPLTGGTRRALKIERRLAELDEEWDVERYLETMAPTFTLAGMVLGLTVSRKFFVLPFVVSRS